MQLVEQHIIKSNNPYYKNCDSLCFHSKNLYNSCLYAVRQDYILNQNNIIYDLHHRMKDTDQYRNLPAKVSSTVLNSVTLNFKSFFAALAAFKDNPAKFNSRPKLPQYLDKDNGRFFVSYTNQAISKKVFNKTKKIKLSKTNIEFNTKIEDFSTINCVRIIPKIGYYVIEVVYTIKHKEVKEDNSKYCSIDLGLNNLATLTSNVKEIKPLIINGKPLKSINQYYNKKKAKLQGILEVRNRKKSSKQISNLTLKRKNKVDNYLHKASKEIVNHCIVNGLNTLVIGNNREWKQDINIGKKNNQNFVQIPHSRFIEMMSYKCEREGIRVIVTEESYTSKASFLDGDIIPKYGKKKDGEVYKFSGKRVKRGLYRSAGGTLINSDVNGSYNILRKAIPNAFADGIEGVGVHPMVVTIKER